MSDSGSDNKPGWFSAPDWNERVTEEHIAAVRNLPHLHQGLYHNLNIRHALDFYTRRYLAQLREFTDSIGPDSVIADCGAGYGWLAMTAALTTPAKVIAVEPDEERLKTGAEAARIIGIAEDRIDWRVGRLGSLPLGDREVDVAYCVEVLEHVFRDPRAIPDLCRVTEDLLIVTTPNLWFPVVAHDTRLPFCHWLPIPLRRFYAWATGRSNEEHNLFWSPRSLERPMDDFTRVSRFLHYSSLERYLETYPCWLPYGPGGDQRLSGIGRAKRLYYAMASKLGRRSHWILPSLAGVYKRRSTT